MYFDNKERVIGKVVSINSEKFGIELLKGIKNFNINGFDDIHYFAQLNSYVVIPYQNYYIVCEVISIREKDESNYQTSKEQELNKILSNKYFDVYPLGTIKDNKFEFGVSVFPTLYSDVLYIKDEELDIIFNISNIEEKVDENNTKLNSLSIGKSAIFKDYDIKININKFFGSHSAILGNTGSGKSCTIASMLQQLFKKKNFSATGATFIIFDTNGEYKQAFENLKIENSDIDIYYISLNDEKNPFYLPHHFMNIEEWELLLQASEKAQLPILRSALQIASLLTKSKKDNKYFYIIDHIKAISIKLILDGDGNETYKSSKITTILRAFETDTFSLKTENISEKLKIQFGRMNNIEEVKKITEKFIKSNIKLFESTSLEPFDFYLLEEALELAILYEEAHGNNQIRNYCASLLTRFKTIKQREDFSFIKNKNEINIEDYLFEFLGIDKDNFTKKTQITIIDLNEVEDEIIEIISSVFTRILFDFLKKQKYRNIFPINLILEEAHRYIAYDSKRTFLRASQIFDRVAKEGRKYGLFLMISSQRPSELSKTVLSQCNNFIVHRIQNPDDLLHIRQMTPHISDTILKKLPSIPTQHALIFGNAVNIPALFKVNEANPLPRSDNNEISKNWFVKKNKDYKLLFEK
ncbi:ATP-binding protein [Caminibacter mediatlanticus]|uniref:Helicase HerA central domain-containing protein n=1 Tax=Caminibacter mediatlanticus TB-2 TaxID=391592 RepID=A0AAI9AHY3_9BACT|nr:ATP-binding protein [Caminibacter mediatlanticus]EDM23834.1 hypothetical protein CMTB2_01164 [Caminibacter mediatlanticus TB-2]